MRFNKFSIVAISFLTSISFIACGDNDDSTSEENKTIISNQGITNLHTRIAEIVDSNISKVAQTISNYIQTNNETYTLQFTKDWNVIGFVIDVEDTKVIELSNSKYEAIITNKGNSYSSILPFKIIVRNHNNKVVVDILNPNTVFQVFFNKLSDSEKQELKIEALNIKKEIKEMVYASLEDNLEPLDLEVGRSIEVDSSIFKIVPYPIVTKFYKGNSSFSSSDLKAVANTIISVLGTSDNYSQVNGLSSDWYSLRREPISTPNYSIVEAYSVKYSETIPYIKLAISTNSDDDKTLQISFLNPKLQETIKYDEVKNSSNIQNDIEKIILESIAQFQQSSDFNLTKEIPPPPVLPTND